MPVDDRNQTVTGWIAGLANKTNGWISNDPQGWKAAMVFWLARKLPHCNQVSVMMSEEMDTRVTFMQRIKVKLHLIVCLACVRYNQHLYFLREATRKMSNQFDEPGDSATLPALPADTRDRLKEALSKRIE